MSVRTRNLLDRFRSLILRTVLVAENSLSLSIENVLCMVNVHELTETAELGVYHSFRNKLEFSEWHNTCESNTRPDQ